MFKPSKHLNLIHAAFALLLVSSFSCQNSSYQSQKVESQTIYLDDSFKEDQSVVDFIAPIKDSIDIQMNQIIGHAARTLDKNLPEGLLTNFVSDLILEESRAVCQNNDKKLPQPDMALMNHKGLRTIIEEGPVTVNNIFQLMPFENEIVLVTLNREQTIEFLDYIASEGGDGIAGATFTIKNGKASNIKINGQTLSRENYVVATSDYLSKGGDHYDVFKKGTVTETKVKLRDMIIDHIKKLEANNQKIDAKLDNRIK